jgi:Fuc2NAc and GlcNAc transferase
VSLIVLGAIAALRLNHVLALGLGGAAVAIVGYLDDRQGLSVLSRISVHIFAAVAAVTFLWLEARMQSELEPGWILLGLLALGIVWGINLFNFMDGIDGIAASQAIFVSSASAALIGTAAVAAPGWIALLLASASACTGFLAWNWPPARIFLGDVGSGFIGFWLAALGVALIISGIMTIWTSMVLSAVFVSDASSSLRRRVMRGDRWHEAHRLHAYQILARSWRSHRRVTLLLWLINVAFVLPCAYATVLWKDLAPWIAVGTLVVLAIGCLGIGAGKTSE